MSNLPWPYVLRTDLFIHSYGKIDTDSVWSINSPMNRRSKRKDPPVFWPQELLPQEIPEARIFTFGFETLEPGWRLPACQNIVQKSAEGLLSALADLRLKQKDQSIPIIFVAHSLGGYVIKEALNQSASLEDKRCTEILSSVIGVCFLGTPHRGSRNAPLGMQAAEIAIASSTPPSLRDGYRLPHLSEFLAKIGYNFQETIRRNDIKICSFQEENRASGGLPFGPIVSTVGVSYSKNSF